MEKQNCIYCLTNYSSLLWYSSWNLLICKSLYLKYPTAWCKFDSSGSQLTVPGHVINVYFCYKGAFKQCKHQTKTSVFLTRIHFIQNFYFKINKTHVLHDLTITPSFTYCIENKTKRIRRWRKNKFNNKICFSFWHYISSHFKKCNKLFWTLIVFTKYYIFRKSLRLTRNCRRWTRSNYQQVCYKENRQNIKSL